MARTKKTEEKAEAKTEAKTEFKYTVADLEEATGLKAASIRVGLRDSDFERTGRSWGWDKKTDFDAVVKYFKARADRKPAMKSEDSDKPAKKSTKPRASRTRKAAAA